MNGKLHKYVFITAISILFLVMLYGSRETGVSCDEVLHYNQSVAVYNYFVSGGNDQTALESSESYLRYYGQSYDNLTTFFIKEFKIDDIYRFRHIMASIAGWLAILVTALFAVWLAGYGAGITVIILFAISPTFIGHSQNNLKDIPFALGYISSLFFIIRFLSSEKKLFFTDIVMLVLSMAFCMSIRAGGMILILYLFGFFIFYELVKYYRAKTINLGNVGKKLGVIMLVAILTWFMSVVLWPYGLQNPVLNPVKAHILMSRFPITFREVFEGKVEWTDYMPWYYLIKYMLITFPLTVIAGLIFFAFYLPLLFRKLKSVEYLLLSFTVLFPVIYVVCFRPNIYSGWRQFLFLYPGVIILSASGITVIINHLRRKYLKGILIILLLFLSLHPLKFLLTCYRYAYMYYNPLTGGLKGANGNYETDYYFIGQREAAEWLNNYLEQKGIKDTVIVGSNFSAEWYFRKNYFVKNIYFRNEERSNYDWDFYLSTNRYILPSRLREGLWPPDDAIKVVYACGTPVCAVIKRKSKDSYYGYRALHENRLNDAEEFFYKALQECSDDEMIFYNFAITLNRKADSVRADSALQNCLIINPFFEPALMYAGIISESKRKYDEAEKYYKNLLGYNRKYFEAYVRLAEITEKKDIKKARSILRECLRINPVYKPAILKLAGTYRESHPEIAEKYDSLAKMIR